MISKIQRVDLTAKIVDIDYDATKIPEVDFGMIEISMSAKADMHFLNRLVKFLKAELGPDEAVQVKP